MGHERSAAMGINGVVPRCATWQIPWKFLCKKIKSVSICFNTSQLKLLIAHTAHIGHGWSQLGALKDLNQEETKDIFMRFSKMWPAWSDGSFMPPKKESCLRRSIRRSVRFSIGKGRTTGVSNWCPIGVQLVSAGDMWLAMAACRSRLRRGCRKGSHQWCPTGCPWRSLPVLKWHVPNCPNSQSTVARRAFGNLVTAVLRKCQTREPHSVAGPGPRRRPLRDPKPVGCSSCGNTLKNTTERRTIRTYKNNERMNVAWNYETLAQIGVVKVDWKRNCWTACCPPSSKPDPRLVPLCKSPRPPRKGIESMAEKMDRSCK